MRISLRKKSVHYPIHYNKKKVHFGRLTSGKDILSLFKCIFDRELGNDLLQWFAAAPLGPNIWYGAFENNQPVGLYGLLPIIVKVGRNTYKGALCNNVGVIPRFYGSGLFQDLGRVALKDSQCPVVVTVPNPQAVRAHKVIGWQSYGVYELLSAEIGERRVDYDCYPQFKYIPFYKTNYFCIVKDENFMKWRYSKPNEKYFQSFFGDNSYVIWKEYQGKKQVMEISDFTLIYKLNGRVDIWQFKDSLVSVQLKNSGFDPVLAREFLLYTDLKVDGDISDFNFEPADNDVF